MALTPKIEYKIQDIESGRYLSACGKDLVTLSTTANSFRFLDPQAAYLFYDYLVATGKIKSEKFRLMPVTEEIRSGE